MSEPIVSEAAYCEPVVVALVLVALIVVSLLTEVEPVKVLLSPKSVEEAALPALIV